MTLKQQNQSYIIVYVVINFSILFVFYQNGSFNTMDFLDIFQKFSVKDGVYFVLLGVITIVFQGIIPNEIKEGILVFWKEKGYLAGCEAFSKYVKKDHRINKENLIEKYGTFPRSFKKQNSLWYSIYGKLSDKRINKVHKDYLLFREFTSFSVLFILFFPFLLYIVTDINLKILISYIGFLCMQYFVVRYSAKNYAERLVTNVLALASTK